MGCFMQGWKNVWNLPKSCESLANGFIFAMKHAKFHNFLKIVRKTTANAFAKGEKISFAKNRSQTPVQTLLQTETYRHFAKKSFRKNLRKGLQKLKTRKTVRKTICETFCERWFFANSKNFGKWFSKKEDFWQKKLLPKFGFAKKVAKLMLSHAYFCNIIAKVRHKSCKNEHFRTWNWTFAIFDRFFWEAIAPSQKATPTPK